MRRPLTAIAAGLILAVALSAAADAASSGRAQFVKRADNLCQPQRNDAKRRIAHGIKLLGRERVRAAGREFARAYREVRTGYRRVSRLPRPADDRRRIAKWLRREREATATGVRSATALKHRRFARAARLSDKAALLERRAARPVRNFGFEHCRPL